MSTDTAPAEHDVSATATALPEQAPSQALTTSNERALIADRIYYAQTLSASGMLPKAFVGKPANVLWAIELGRVLDLEPVVAMQQIHVIEGKPGSSALLIGALIRKAGHKLRVLETADAQGQPVVTATLYRKDDPEFPFVVKWDMDRAKAAGLLGKDNWKKDPRSMMIARATAGVGRMGAPEALLGLGHTVDELEEQRAAEPVTVPNQPGGAIVQAAEAARPTAAAQPAPAVELGGDGQPIEDAEIVEAPADFEDGVIIDAADVRRLNTALSQAGFTKRDDRIEFVRHAAGVTDLISTKDLTTAQAAKVRRALEQRAASETGPKPDTAPATDDRAFLVKAIGRATDAAGLTLDDVLGLAQNRYGRHLNELDLGDLGDLQEHLRSLVDEPGPTA